MAPPPVPRRFAVALLGSAVLVVGGGCGGDEPQSVTTTIAKDAPPATTPRGEPDRTTTDEDTSSGLPAPERLPLREGDLRELHDAAVAFARENPDAVGKRPVEGPFEGAAKAASWGDYDYAIGSFSSGSELDETAFLHRSQSGGPWTVAQWIEASDVTATCLLPRPLALLWAPDVAASPACAKALTAQPGQRFRTFDGAVACTFAVPPEVDPVCANDHPQEAAAVQLETATIGWGAVVEVQGVRCTSAPDETTCSTPSGTIVVPPEGEIRTVPRPA